MSAPIKIRTSSLNEFIERSKSIHGNKYNYSKVIFVNNLEKIIIICEQHGEFEQRPKEHYSGRGCKKCFHDKLSYTTDKFIQKAKQIHKDKYDYSNTIYIDSKTKINIICKKHGLFEQIAANHLNGSGCKKCSFKNKIFKPTSDLNIIHGKPFTNEEFIQKSKNKFPNKFNYSNTVYLSTRDKVNLQCIGHNQEFTINAGLHLRGETGGCPKCIYENASKRRAKSQEKFINECNLIHNKKYNYTKVKYINGNKKITIICNVHGEFDQQAGAHLQGQGCPKCFVHKNENECKNIIEKLTDEYFTRERPKFLNKLEYDCYNDTLKLALEYNGIQHYEYSPFFHNNNRKKFEKQQENDKLKKELSHQKGIYLIVVPYWIIDKEKFINDEYQNYLFLQNSLNL